MEYHDLVKLYYKDKLEYKETYEKRYHGEETKRFDFDVSGNPAFLVLTQEIAKLNENILKENNFLVYYASKLPGEALLQFELKCLVEEIKMTNDIEGVASTRKEIEDALEAVRSHQEGKRLFMGIANKYLMLSSKGITQPLSTCQDIRDIYDELVYEEVAHDDPGSLPDGVLFRKEPVFMQKNYERIHTGLMPESKIIQYLDIGLKIIVDPQMLGLVSIAVFHYLFGYVHPFYDGNGRMARYLSSILLRKEVLFLAAFNLSAVIKREVRRYYKAFALTNDPKNKGDLTPFVTIFLEFILEAIEQLSEELKTLMEKYDHFKLIIEQNESFMNSSKTYKVLVEKMLINTLFGSQGMDVKKLADACETTVNTIRYLLNKMDKAMLRTERDGHRLLYDLDLDFLEKL